MLLNSVQQRHRNNLHQSRPARTEWGCFEQKWGRHVHSRLVWVRESDESGLTWFGVRKKERPQNRALARPRQATSNRRQHLPIAKKNSTCQNLPTALQNPLCFTPWSALDPSATARAVAFAACWRAETRGGLRLNPMPVPSASASRADPSPLVCRLLGTCWPLRICAIQYTGVIGAVGVAGGVAGSVHEYRLRKLGVPGDSGL